MNWVRNICILAGVAILVLIGFLVLWARKGKQPAKTYPTSTWNTGESVSVPEGESTTFDELDPFKDIILDDGEESDPDYAAITGSDVVTLPFVLADKL